MLLAEQLKEKWGGLLEHSELPPIVNSHKKRVTAVLLENTVTALRQSGSMAPVSLLGESGSIPVNYMGASSSTAGDGNIDTFDPVMVTLVRRAYPNLMAFDTCGVQPMTGPAGIIFAMRSRYANQIGGETFHNEVNTAFSTVVSGANTLGQKHVGTVPGNTTVTANLAEAGFYNFGSGMSTAQGEALGSTGNVAWPEMSFSIEKVSVTAKERALKAEYTMEIAQDLKTVHGLDAETELANILTHEILAEINREVIRTIYVIAKKGATSGTTDAGVFDLDSDSNGRWSVEKWKGLMYQIEREANVIAKETRRGKGNFIICSSDVASALVMAGILDYTPALDSGNLVVDDTGNTFAGVLLKRYKVYVDPYAGGNFLVVGYKGQNAFDSGLFYCPYVPLQMVRAVDPDTFHPKIGFKTRYGMVANPYAEGLTAGSGALTKDSNVYYRRVIVNNLL